MICPASIDSTPQTSPETFTNWARALSFTAATGFHPASRGEVVEIIRQAVANGKREWTGSIWSFTGNYIASDFVIQSDGITGVIDNVLILNHLNLADPSLSGSLVHIKGGTKVFNVNRLLHGLPAATNGGGCDEQNLECKAAVDQAVQDSWRANISQIGTALAWRYKASSSLMPDCTRAAGKSSRSS